MQQSVLTSKGQTTIPKAIRQLLNLKPNERLLYLIEDGKVILKTLQGDILELRSSVKTGKKPDDFHAIRTATRRIVARKLVEGEWGLMIV